MSFVHSFIPFRLLSSINLGKADCQYLIMRRLGRNDQSQSGRLVGRPTRLVTGHLNEPIGLTFLNLSHKWLCISFFLLLLSYQSDLSTQLLACPPLENQKRQTAPVGHVHPFACPSFPSYGWPGSCVVLHAPLSLSFRICHLSSSP